MVGFLCVDGESQWDFVLFFVETLTKKSARQNGKGNMKRRDAGHPQGRRCKSGVEEAARKWRTRGTSRIRTEQRTLLRQTNRNSYHKLIKTWILQNC